MYIQRKWTYSERFLLSQNSKEVHIYSLKTLRRVLEKLAKVLTQHWLWLITNHVTNWDTYTVNKMTYYKVYNKTICLIDIYSNKVMTDERKKKKKTSFFFLCKRGWQLMEKLQRSYGFSRWEGCLVCTLNWVTFHPNSLTLGVGFFAVLLFLL